MGPLLFLIYINDIVKDINSFIRLFADDTCLYIIVDSPEEAAHTNNYDVVNIYVWAEKWLVSFNTNKIEYILLSRKFNKHVNIPVIMNIQIITKVESHRHFGVTFESSDTWHKHIHKLITTKLKAWQRIHVMRKLKFRLDRKALETIAFIRQRELVALLDLSSWCLVVAGRLFLSVPRGCPQFVIVVFTDHTHLLF